MSWIRRKMTNAVDINDWELGFVKVSTKYMVTHCINGITGVCSMVEKLANKLIQLFRESGVEKWIQPLAKKMFKNFCEWIEGGKKKKKWK